MTVIYRHVISKWIVLYSTIQLDFKSYIVLEFTYIAEFTAWKVLTIVISHKKTTLISGLLICIDQWPSNIFKWIFLYSTVQLNCNITSEFILMAESNLSTNHCGTTFKTSNVYNKTKSWWKLTLFFEFNLFINKKLIFRTWNIYGSKIKKLQACLKTKRNLLPFADVAELPCKHRIEAFGSHSTMEKVLCIQFKP